MKLHVQPIAGETFRFYVDSKSRPDMPHLVDLESYRWGGQCSCEAFKFKHEPALSRLTVKTIPDDSYRCSHIKAARSYYMDEIFPKLAAAIRRIAAPTSRLMEAQGLITAIQQSADSVTTKINDLNDIKSHVEKTIEQITTEVEA
jgi:hypothetical protein